MLYLFYYILGYEIVGYISTGCVRSSENFGRLKLGSKLNFCLIETSGQILGYAGYKIT